MSAQTDYSHKCNNQDRPSIHSIASKCKDETKVLDNCKTIEEESDGALLKLKEDNRKLKQEVEKLRDLLKKQELNNKRTGGCEDVAAIKEDNSSVKRGKMPSSQYGKIQGNYTTLQKQITKPIDVCRELFSAFIFDDHDKRKIESERDRIEQTDKLLMILLESGPHAFDAFLRALSATGHCQAKQILEQDGCEDFAAIKEDNNGCEDVAAIKEDNNGCEDVAAIKEDNNGCEDVAAIKEDNNGCEDVAAIKEDNIDFDMKTKIENRNRDKLDEMKDKIERSIKSDYGCDATATILRNGGI